MFNVSEKHMKAKVGDHIRSYDFEGVDHCFVEGVVTSIEGMYVYGIKTREVWDGKEVPEEVGAEWRCIQNGTPTWTGGKTNFITILEPIAA